MSLLRELGDYFHLIRQRGPRSTRSGPNMGPPQVLRSGPRLKGPIRQPTAREAENLGIEQLFEPTSRPGKPLKLLNIKELATNLE